MFYTSHRTGHKQPPHSPLKPRLALPPAPLRQQRLGVGGRLRARETLGVVVRRAVGEVLGLKGARGLGPGHTWIVADIRLEGAFGARLAFLVDHFIALLAKTG
jgi:hypothetical protein